MPGPLIDVLEVAVVQAAGPLFDVGAGVDKACQLIADAAGRGARLVLLPEAFIGGYPRGLSFGTVVGSRTAEGRDMWARYHSGALEIPGPGVEQLAEPRRQRHCLAARRGARRASLGRRGHSSREPGSAPGGAVATRLRSVGALCAPRRAFAPGAPPSCSGPGPMGGHRVREGRLNPRVSRAGAGSGIATSTRRCSGGTRAPLSSHVLDPYDTTPPGSEEPRGTGGDFRVSSQVGPATRPASYTSMGVLVFWMPVSAPLSRSRSTEGRCPGPGRWRAPSRP